MQFLILLMLFVLVQDAAIQASRVDVLVETTMLQCHPSKLLHLFHIIAVFLRTVAHAQKPSCVLAAVQQVQQVLPECWVIYLSLT